MLGFETKAENKEPINKQLIKLIGSMECVVDCFSA